MTEIFETINFTMTLLLPSEYRMRIMYESQPALFLIPKTKRMKRGGGCGKSTKPKTDEAEKLFYKGMKLKDIASRLEVPEGTVRRWKNTYKWNSERSDKKANILKRGGQIGNKNAAGGNQSAPLRNHNAEKFGFFRKYLPEETVSIIEEMPKDPLDVLWDQIQIAYAAIIRAQQNHVRAGPG